MYSVEIVERLMALQKKSAADLSDFLYGDRKHCMRHLLKEGANPTAEYVEKVADFLGVSIDEIYGRYNPRSESDQNIELMKKLIKSQEIQLEMRAEENNLLKEKIKLLELQMKASGVQK